MTERMEPIWLAVLVAAVMGIAPVQSAAAQDVANRALAKRADLEAALNSDGQGKQPRLSDRERETIDRRLKDGDFQPGDQMVMTLRVEKVAIETLTVRPGLILDLPDMEAMSVRGVLRSEVEDRLRTHLKQFIRDPQVQVQTLVRVGVLGSVARPGYYSARADQPLGEVLMMAGGLSPEADLRKTKVLRNSHEYWPRDDVRRALASGKSVDQLGMQGGDEIMVDKKSGGFSGALPIIAALSGIALATIGIMGATK